MVFVVRFYWVNLPGSTLHFSGFSIAVMVLNSTRNSICSFVLDIYVSST